MILYNIYHFMFDSLFSNQCIVDNKLICDEFRTRASLNSINEGIDKKRINLLFDQVFKMNNEKNLSQEEFNSLSDEEKDKRKDYFLDKFIIIDFSNTKKISKNLKKIENGIEINLNGKRRTFKLFLKSNSMSKKSMVLFATTEKVDDEISFYDKINSRVTLDLNKEKKPIPLSKWFAYTGTVLSDCVSLLDYDKNLFNGEKIVVVADSKKRTDKDFECITAISSKMIYDEIFVKNYSNKSGIIKYISEMNNGDIYLKDDSFVKDVYDELLLYKDSLEKKNKKFETGEYGKELFENIKQIISVFENINNKVEVIEKLKEIKSNFSQRNEFETIFLKSKLEINLFDGEGLISPSFAEKINAKLIADRVIDCNNKQYSFQIRLPFVKGVVHTCNFKQFFEDNGVDIINCLTLNSKGKKTQSVKIEDVEIILTESQFKAVNFINEIKKNSEDESNIDAYFRFLKEYEYPFGISGIEPINVDENGIDDSIEIYNHPNQVRLNSQFFSTMPLSNDLMDRIIENNIKKLKNLRRNDIIKNLEIFKNIENYQGEKKSDIQLIMSQSNLYKETRKDIIESTINEMFQLKLYVAGKRLFLSGDLLHLLYNISGKIITEEEREKTLIGKKDFYSFAIKRQEKNKAILILRNPHYSRNEIGYKELISEEKAKKYKKYFSGDGWCLKNVLFINPFSGISDRLSGADYDGDTVAVVTDQSLVQNVRFNLQNNELDKYPIIKIPTMLGKKLKSTYKNICKCMNDTFASRVGKISNSALKDSFIAYSIIDSKYDGQLDEKMAKYTILAGLEIDSAKNGIKPILINSEEKDVIFNKRNVMIKDLLESEDSINKESRGQLFILIKNGLKNNSEDIKTITNAIEKMYVIEKEKCEKNKSNIYYMLSKLSKNLNDNENFNDVASVDKDKIIKVGKKIENIIKRPTDNFTKMIAALIIFKQFNRIIYPTNQQKGKFKTGIPKLDNDLKKLINDKNNKNIDFKKITDEINEDNIDYLNKLFSTEKSEPYQYSKNPKKLIDTTIKNNTMLNFICDFSNNGNYALFLLLVYKNILTKDIQLDIEKKSVSDFIDSNVKLDMKDQIDKIYKFIEDTIISINLVLKNYKEESMSDLKKKIYTILKELVKDCNFEDYLYCFSKDEKTRNIFKNLIFKEEKFVFDILENKFLDFIDKL